MLKFVKIPVKSDFLGQIGIVSNLRHGHTLRGKRPGVARTLAQRLNDEKTEDPELERKINIGFPKLKPSRTMVLQERIDHIKSQRNNPELEKIARSNKLEIDLEEVKNQWKATSGPYQIMKIANHYGVFEHLFGKAFFYPQVHLEIKFDIEKSDLVHPVYYGNVIKPVLTKKPPTVDFDSSFSIKKEKSNEKSLWTLIMTNPDGHLTQPGKEYVHWFVANIEGNDLKSGQVIVPYFRAFPPKGTGYHRHVFVLYKQEKRIDFKEYQLSSEVDLEKRTFETLEFYRKFQDEITPAGLAFFQSDYDDSVTEVFHNILKTPEPVYEYDFPQPYHSNQEWFPPRKPFNLYMDKYRDPKQINKEYLEKKLAKTHPFNGPEPPLKYPNAHGIKNAPSWLLTEIQKNRLRWGRINDIE